MNVENLLFILVFAAIVFANVVLPWLRRRAAVARRGPAGPEPADAGFAEEADEDTPGAVTPVQARQALAALPAVDTDGPRRAQAPAQAQVRRSADRRWLHAPPTSLSEARRGMVLRTILGPCRAQEPFDVR